MNGNCTISANRTITNNFVNRLTLVIKTPRTGLIKPLIHVTLVPASQQ
ncbi:hypothetical protein BIFCAT_01620 [Bifidobacterium catenulatum DSM 16992 = JCM 1194 = LMG 11043]|uniref:Uncharacterized protein n=1 Tax=Bifidobacterium catenulatum DSM 16992 = JCM 1194 = LMG 11043 TaxID=566552 RepID=B6XWG2_9BIFI|nr:hypothetical protein BIFCAT_01620 [Bifidobacterium catenulatum DSM 16992 = JCM 1194 = LMG 11043]